MLFIDTSAWLAWYHKRDPHHAAAVEVWRAILAQGGNYATSSFVLDELFTLLGRRLEYRFAADRARSIYRSDLLTILRPDEDDETKALVYFEKFADQRVSFTDCVSFALMRRRRIERVFAFDRHFAIAGFSVIPGAFPAGATGWVAETPEPYVVDE